MICILFLFAITTATSTRHKSAQKNEANGTVVENPLYHQATISDRTRGRCARSAKIDTLRVEEICYSLAFTNKSIIHSYIHFASLIMSLENDKWYGKLLQHRRLSNS